MNLVLLLLSLSGLFCSTIAVSITKCRAEDTPCLKKSADMFVPILAVGIPEIGTKSLDPLHIPRVASNNTSELRVVATNLVVTGMKECTIPYILRDVVNHNINVDVLCSVDVQGEWDVKGKILVLPVDGSGHVSIQLSKILISVKSHIKDVVKDGKTYWSVDHWDFTWDLKDRANLELIGLFGGNAEMSKAIRELMGESANDIIKEVGPPIVIAITSEVVDAIKHLFNHVPVEDLALN